jgi:hypothetical protein
VLLTVAAVVNVYSAVGAVEYPLSVVTGFAVANEWKSD